ncbi:unnamed protein product [Mycena citricolor]|uniref:Protein kinase domain-containing protein n=1 Tax=Mycena citricolor TaxID=2018698 RepID=A0AAD2GQY4_9AGAR|nr:unnamed protein product [Mycena citricolor]
MSGPAHKHTGSISVTQNQKAQLANAYNELGKELSSSRIRVVGNYTLGKVIGEGAYGKVRMGTHRLTSTRVAIKQIPKEVSASLTREIHHHRQLHHTHVIQMYEVIATESHIWIVSELCLGGELFDYLVEKGRLAEDETKVIFGQLCLAVAYLHDKGIVHRDLKLENVLLDERCRVKLGDFGFTREFERGAYMETFCGTTGYASPEMLEGRKYLGPEVDVWSLGVILYVLLTGTLPFDDDDEDIMRKKIIVGEFEDPEWLSEDSRDLIKNILQRDPVKRLAIPQILSHPWFTRAVATRTDTVDSHQSSTASVSDVSDPNPFFSEENYSSTPTTPDEKPEDKEKTTYIHRTASELTIRKTDLELLHSKLVASLSPTVQEEDEVSPPARQPSSMSLGPPPVTRTPARTKRRSVSSVVSDPEEPPEETQVLTPDVPAAPSDPSQPQISFVSMLGTPAPMIFSTPLERELLNSLSVLGLDTAQIVHSVLSDACDSAGALWWMLKRRSEKQTTTLLDERHASVGTQTEPPRAKTNGFPPQLSFVPPTPTVMSSMRPSTPPHVISPRATSPSPMLSPAPSTILTGESSSRSHPSTPAGSVKDKEGKTRKGRSGSVSIMQRATTALEAAGLVRKKSAEVIKEKEDKREMPERKSSLGESSHASVAPSTSSKLTKSPPLRPSKDKEPSTPPPHIDIHPMAGSPWVLTGSRDSLPQHAPTPANSPGPDVRPSVSAPNIVENGSTGSKGSHRHRANLLTTFRLWFQDERKGKRKQGSAVASSTGPPLSRSSSQAYPPSSKRGGRFNSRGHRQRPSASSRRSSSVNSRRSSITSVQMIVLDSPQVTGRRSLGSHTPNSERGEFISSRPSSIRSFSMQRHRKSPSASSGEFRTASPIQKYHHRHGSGSSTRVVRHIQTTTTSTSRPPHKRSNSGASSTHSPASSRPGSFYELPQLQRSASDVETFRTGSPFKPNSRPHSRTRGTSVDETRRTISTTTTSTTFIAQKRTGAFASASGSIGRSSWKKSWGLEPPGWQSRTGSVPVEVLAMSPISDGTTIRDVFSNSTRHGLGLGGPTLGMSAGDESDWVDEDDDDIPMFAGGLGQVSSKSGSSSYPAMETVSLSPAPRSHRASGKRTGGSTTTTGAANNTGSRQTGKGHSPMVNTAPLPSEPHYESTSRRQIPNHGGRNGPAAIQEEDEGEEEDE